MNRAIRIGRRSARGFTLVEMLAVIAIISIFVLTASPSFVQLMRDRRVNRAAMHLVDSYRTARTRAMGHGQPVLATWNNTTGAQLITVSEPVVTGASLAPTCGTANFANEVSVVSFNQDRYAYTSAVLWDYNASNSFQRADVCFTPSGRAYLRTGTNAAFTPMTQPIQFKVENTRTKLTRLVFVPPSGVARMQL